jgi:hypothetical protein
MDHLDPADRLTRRDGPHLHLLVASPSEAYDLAVRLCTKPETVARVVRGTKCRTSSGLFDEIAAAWQFPPYFGANWDALDECLGDLEWLPAKAYVLVVTEADQLLADEPPDALRVFVELLAGLGHGGPKAASEGRHGATFHAVFQVDAAHQKALADRLKAASATFDSI